MRMKLKKWIFLWMTSILMSLFLGMTAFAGIWKMGMEQNQARWWYDYEDGNYAMAGWQWIDGNKDGVAECYYFDEEGWMLANTVTPDGYQVNGDGAWVENGEVVTKTVSVQSEAQNRTSADQLVVYFSRTGTTERVAQKISEVTGARTVKLEVAESYPSSYQSTLNRAEQELSANARPEITTKIENIAQYNTIYLGYPIWYGTAPMPVFTFLETYDLSGKTIVPFCTSGSSGIETSVREIRQICSNANVTNGRRCNDLNGIENWLSGLGLLP